MDQVKPLKLWVMSAEYEPHILGGLGVVATNLTPELKQLGLEVTVITMAPSSAISVVKKNKVTVIRFPSNHSVLKTTQYLHRKGYGLPDLIHIHSLQHLPLLFHYKEAAEVPAVYTCHSLVLKKGKRKAFSPQRQARLLRCVEHVVVPSKAEYRKLVRYYPFCAGKTTVIPHGVSLHVGNSTNVSKFRLLYAGRLVHNKGLEELIDAVALLRVKHPHTRLFVIGSGTKKYTQELRRRAIKGRVSRAISWLGKYSHKGLQNAYRRYGVVVMPSRVESFGLVALEALAHGVPLAATRVGGLSMFVTRDVAEVIDRVKASAIAATVVKVWSSPNLTLQRVAAGLALARQYDWPNAASKYAKLFLHVCCNREM